MIQQLHKSLSVRRSPDWLPIFVQVTRKRLYHDKAVFLAWDTSRRSDSYLIHALLFNLVILIPSHCGQYFVQDLKVDLLILLDQVTLDPLPCQLPTPAEVQQLKLIPDLVFANCIRYCWHLAKWGRGSLRHRLLSWYLDTLLRFKNTLCCNSFILRIVIIRKGWIN